MISKNHKNGFTLIEVLAVIVIIGIIGGVGIVAYRTFFKTSEERYYETIESSVLLAGNDYFTDHRGEIPTDNNYSEVSLASLIDAKYMEPIKDSSGNLCTEGMVYAYRDNNKVKYEVCLINCGEYSSKGKYCGEKVSKEIGIFAKKILSNAEYNTLRSYAATEYSNNENILVSFSMDHEFAIAHYTATRTTDNLVYSCTPTNNKCDIVVDESGTYLVSAVDDTGKEISRRYINIKIAKGGAKFTLASPTKYVITKQECNSRTNTKRVHIEIIKEVIGEEYKSVEYRINGGNYQAINNMFIEQDLESGHYDIEVVAINSVDKATIKTISIDVAYPIDIEYEDDHSTITHEVVTGQTYNYLSPLPITKLAYGLDLEIRWYKNNVQISPTDIVEENCTFKIIGKTAVLVDDVSAEDYCKTNLKYTGREQILTNNPPTGVKFADNTGINAGDYKVKVQLESAQYIWGDGTTTDREITCSIGKKTPTISLSKSSCTLVYDATDSVTVTTDGDGQISCSTSDSNIATCSVNNKTVTIMSQPSAADNKKATITIKQGEGDNYLAASKEYTVTVNRKTLTCPGSPADQEFTGSDILSGITCPTGSTAGGTQKGKSVGEYYQTCTANKGYKFSGTCSVKWKITQKPVTITVPTVVSDNLTYNGKDQYLLATAGSCSKGGTMYWYSSNPTTSSSAPKFSTSSGWTKTAPTTTSYKGKGAGTYYIWYYCYVKDTTNYSGTGINKETSVTKQIAKAANPISVTATQTWSINYSDSDQTKTITAATKAEGNVSYKINSQKSGSTSVSYFTISGTTLTLKGGSSVGTYTVVIRATAEGNDNYESGYKDITMTVTVGKMALTCPSSPADKEYTGSDQNSGITCPTGSNAEGDTKGKNVKEYTQTCAPDSNHSFASTCSVKWKITQKPVSVTAPTVVSVDLSYTGKDQALLATVGSCSTGGTMYWYSSNPSTSSTAPTFSTSSGWTKTTPTTSTYKGKNAGTYYIWYYCYVSDTSNYSGTDINKVKSVSKQIAKIPNPISVTATQSWSQSYSTSNQTKTIIAATNAQGTVSYEINSQKSGSTNVSYFTISDTTLTLKGSTPVGTYTVVIRATAAGNSNYESGYKDITMTVTVTKASLTCPNSPADKEYTGSDQNSGITCPTGSTAEGDKKGKVVKDYVQTCTPDGNHSFDSACSVSWKIKQKAVTVTAPTVVSTALTYNGKDRNILSKAGSCSTGGTMYWYSSNPTTSSSAPTFSTSSGWTTTAPTSTTYKGKGAGTYYIWYYCYVSDTTNYSGTDINAVKSVTKVIDKKSPTFSISSTSGTLTYPTKGTVTVTTDGDGTVTCSSSNTSVATCSVSSKKVTITPAAVDADGKTATITIAQDAGTNYLAASGATYAVTVNQKVLTCPSSPKDKAYNAAEQNSGVTCPTGSNAGGDTKGKAVKDYSQTCTATTGYRFASACAVLWKIVQKSVGVTAPTVVSGTVTYNGKAQELLASAGSCSTGGTMYWYSSNPTTSSTAPTFSTSSGWTTTAPTSYKQTEPGTYYIWYYCHVSDTTNYKGTSINTVKSVKKAISRITPTFSIPATSGTLTYPNKGTLNVTTDGDGTVTCKSSDTSVATCSVSGKVITITPVANTEDNKTATLTIGQKAGTYYGAATSVEYTVTVNRGTLTCPNSPANKTYTGKAQKSGVSCPTGSSAGGDTSKTDTGSYSQTCTANTGYKFASACSVNWKIVVNCGAGKYLPANTQACDNCPDGSFCEGTGDVISSTSDQGKKACPSGYGKSDGARSAASNCYKESKKKDCVGHTVKSRCGTTEGYVNAGWVTADWIPNTNHLDQTEHDTKCLEKWAVICNGSDLKSGGKCYQYSHSGCYCDNYSECSDVSRRNWALQRTATYYELLNDYPRPNCDCRRVVPLSDVACKIYSGTNTCV